MIETGLAQFEAEWSALSRLGPNRGLAIDIGSNRGLYALRLAGLYERVVAFEPNAAISAELTAMKNGKIEVHSKALSSEAGDGILYIPRTAKEELDGWSSFDPTACPVAIESRRCLVEKRTLDQFALVNVGFIKVDVEGHELQVLQGARETLANSHPILLIEIQRANELSVFKFLKECGYQQLDYAERQIALPSDQMFLFRRTECLAQ